MSFHASKAGSRKNMKKSRTSQKYCPDCKMHIRGLNHDKGSHHKDRKKWS